MWKEFISALFYAIIKYSIEWLSREKTSKDAETPKNLKQHFDTEFTTRMDAKLRNKSDIR